MRSASPRFPGARFPLALCSALCSALSLAGSLLVSTPAVAGGSTWSQTPAAAEAQAREVFPEYLGLLKLRSDATVPGDIRATVASLENSFRIRGFATRQLQNGGKPLLFASYETQVVGAKTLLVYMHLDTQPVVPAEWAQPDPWEPVLKARGTDGKWSAVPMERLFEAPLNPELRVFARGASDDKGPIMMFLAALDGMRAAGERPAVNLKVILDSEEEKGSPAISRVIEANRELLACDAIVIHDGPNHASERSTLMFGNRGALKATLTVYGPKSPLHSGHYGNYVPNPALGLAQLLASMKDGQGRVTIPGYTDPVRLSDEEKTILAQVGDDEGAIRRRTGIRTPDQVGANYQEALQYPSLNIRGMAAGSVGEKAANVVPHQAVAELDLRTTPETPPDYLFGLVRKHIEAQGYHLVEGAPTDVDRASYDRLASFTLGGGSRAVRTPMDAPLGTWAYGVLKALGPASPGLSPEPVRIRMMGGTVPTDRLVEGLGAPFVIIPLVNGDNNQHTFDENLRMGHFVHGVRVVQSLLTTPL